MSNSAESNKPAEQAKQAATNGSDFQKLKGAAKESYQTTTGVIKTISEVVLSNSVKLHNALGKAVDVITEKVDEKAVDKGIIMNFPHTLRHVLSAALYPLKPLHSAIGNLGGTVRAGLGLVYLNEIGTKEFWKRIPRIGTTIVDAAHDIAVDGTVGWAHQIVDTGVRKSTHQINQTLGKIPGYGLISLAENWLTSIGSYASTWAPNKVLNQGLGSVTNNANEVFAPTGVKLAQAA